MITKRLLPALLATGFLLVAQGKQAEAKVAPYFPLAVVDKMLQLGELKAGEKIYDLGSGDGRIVIQAARQYQADAYGVELDDSSADLLTIYLLPVAIEKVTPILDQQLKKGARVIAHDFAFPQWTPAKILDVDDGEGRSHRLYLYRR